jgi:tetratricopeptide (TPR) repeat protein
LVNWLLFKFLTYQVVSCWKSFQDLLTNWPNDAFILKTWGDVKQELKFYEGALLDLDKVNILQHDNMFTLFIWRFVRLLLKDYEGALMDFDQANIIERDDTTNLKIWGCLKRKYIVGLV